MLSKNELKRLCRYKQDKYRKADGVFIVEGVKLCEELLKSDFEILTICAVKTWIDENACSIQAKFGRQNKDNKPTSIDDRVLLEVSQSELERLSLLTTPNKVWCLVARKQLQQPLSHKGLTLVLDGIKDPGNLGTIVRLADWYAVDSVICSEESVDIFNPKTVQSTMGSIFRVRVHYCKLTDYLQSLPKSLAVYASLVSDGNSLYSERLPEDAVLIIGSESHGVSPEVRRLVTRNITIPHFKPCKGAESLNAATACAILVSEFKRNTLL